MERNDEPCIFVLQTHQHHLYRLQMYPTVIEDCHASLAPGPRAKDISRKLWRLCADLCAVATWRHGDMATWHAADGYLDIPFPDADQA